MYERNFCSVNVCSVDDFTGPFVSYIREDDSFHTVLRRFGAITGDTDKEWDRCRLAVVRDKTPHFLTRPTHGQGQGQSTDGGDEQQLKAKQASLNKPTISIPSGGSSKSVWALLMEMNPEYAQYNGDLKAVEERYFRSQLKGRKYPTMGIQRPVADIIQSNKTK